MLWLLFASLTAVFEACKDATGKQSLKSLDEYSVLFGFMTTGVAAMWPVLMLTGGIPSLNGAFWGALLVGGVLNIVAFTLYVRALKIADLSLTVPLVTLTPLFLLVTSPLIVQEQPTWADGFGVTLLVIGSYVLNLGAPKAPEDQKNSAVANALAPLARMVRNPGSRLMLCVAFIWSITSTIDKIGVLNSSPLFWVISLFSVIALSMLPLLLLRRQSFRPLLAQWRILTITGLLNATGVTFQMFALPMAPVAQVIAVKRMSALISVLLGHFFFHEKGLRSRLTGAAIMVSGVVIMSLQ
jgi:drug/metabolite transporter (DMT)-like permease